MNIVKNVVNFLFELGQLRFTPRTGWHRLGIKDPQNDAEHSLRVAQIAFVIAIMEGHKNPCHCATIGLFHEITESRFGDPNKVSRRYLGHIDEDLALFDQTYGLGKVGDGVNLVKKEYNARKTHASKIAKDADNLEMMLTAKELITQGYGDAEQFFISGLNGLETQSAKLIGEALKTADPNAWWKEFKTRVEFIDSVI